MDPNASIETAVLAFLRDELTGDDSLDLESSLFQSGLLDSMALTQLVAYVEDRHQVRIGPMDISFATLDTPQLIADLIRRKQTSELGA